MRRTGTTTSSATPLRSSRNSTSPSSVRIVSSQRSGRARPIIARHMSAAIDALTSPTLKHLREDWWDDAFTAFLAETLRPRPGNRILDVGCGEGQAEVAIGRLQISQVRLVGIDLVLSKVL